MLPVPRTLWRLSLPACLPAAPSSAPLSPPSHLVRLPRAQHRQLPPEPLCDGRAPARLVERRLQRRRARLEVDGRRRRRAQLPAALVHARAVRGGRLGAQKAPLRLLHAQRAQALAQRRRRQALLGGARGGRASSGRRRRRRDRREVKLLLQGGRRRGLVLVLGAARRPRRARLARPRRERGLARRARAPRRERTGVGRAAGREPTRSAAGAAARRACPARRCAAHAARRARWPWSHRRSGCCCGGRGTRCAGRRALVRGCSRCARPALGRCGAAVGAAPPRRAARRQRRRRCSGSTTAAAAAANAAAPRRPAGPRTRRGCAAGAGRALAQNSCCRHSSVGRRCLGCRWANGARLLLAGRLGKARCRLAAAAAAASERRGARSPLVRETPADRRRPAGRARQLARAARGGRVAQRGE